MAADAAEDWAEEVRQRDRKNVPIGEKLAFAIGYLRGFKSGQNAKPIGRKQ